jgi:chromosome segregation ATPase
MKKQRTLILATGLFALVVIGCSHEKEDQLTRQVAAQADSIRTMQNMILAQTDSLRSSKQELINVKTAYDSLAVQNQHASKQTSGKLAELNTQVHNLKNMNSNLIDAMKVEEAKNDSADMVLRSLNAIFADTNVTLSNVRGELGDSKMQLADKLELIRKITPWYYKWRQDAHRSFIKVMFAAGKAKKPDFAEPDLTNATTTPPTDTTKTHISL